MNVAVPALATAFAAACVWLIVRIVNRKERWAKRALAALLAGMPVLYLASFGPVCWITRPSRDYCEGTARPQFSTPRGVSVSGSSRRTPAGHYRLLSLAASRQGRIGDLLRWYVCIGKDDDVVPLYYPDSIDWIVPL